MKTIICLGYLTVALLFGACMPQDATLRPVDLRCEYLMNPLGIDVLRPDLSWQLEAADARSRGLKQSSYRVLVASSPELLSHDQGDLWDSGQINSDKSIHVVYDGKQLDSQMSCYWKVRVWDHNGKPSRWSSHAIWSMGLLKKEDWKAIWIGKDGGEENAGSENRRLAARMLRHEFHVEKRIMKATAYVCGPGFFELYLNGRRVGDHVMDPVLSNYSKRVFYVTFDVTNQLCRGRNSIGVILGNGRFFAPRINVPVYTPTFGYPKLLMQIHIVYSDGSVADIISDENWKITASGPIRANNEFDGEDYDARLEQRGWDKVGFNDSAWEPAQRVQSPEGRLIAQMIEPMRITEVLKPVAITSPRPGAYLVDFGQNLYGMVRIRVRGPAGTRIQIRTSFTRRPDGNIKMEDNRSAQSTDVYVLRGEGEETWAPRFRGQGTHYAEVTGWPGVPSTKNFELLCVQTDMEKTGEFTCSDTLINNIYANVVRSTRMQERSVPLDPDRDERQAWLGHPAKTSESEAYIFKVAPFYGSFMGEIRIDQKDDGNISDAGSIWPFYSGDPIWPSVVTILPDWYYNFYGDLRILQQNYDCLKRWVIFQEKTNLGPDGAIRRGTFGDWVDAYTMDGKVWEGGATSPHLLCTAYFYHNCRIAARVAGILGNTEERKRFNELADRVGIAFNKYFFRPEFNNYESETQCSYAVPLAFGLVPRERRKAVADNLVDDIIVKHKGHLSVGLVGMQWFMQVLTDIGRPDVAYTVAKQTTRPGWGYMVSKGGTSVWERWDQDTRDPGMNGESQLILAGNLAAWFYQTLGGINYDPEQPGFKHIILRPRPVGDLTFVRASHQSLYGMIRSEWKIEGGIFRWDVKVPVNATATVYVPAKDQESILESDKPASSVAGIKFLRMEEGLALFEIGAGHYQFKSRYIR